MPLSPPPVERTRLHTRRVVFEGYQRGDGLIDIEARLLDTKDHDYPLTSGLRRAGEPVHDMWVRVTMDPKFVIRDIEACSDRVPYPAGCELIAPAYRRLVGHSLLKGFRQALREQLGGSHGCTHLTELLGYLPTAALQTIAGLRPEHELGEGRPFQLDRCHALETHTDTVRRYYPKWYRGVA
jgi:hypothetical protein